MKKGFVIFAISSVVLVWLQTAMADLSDGLVAYYPFDGNADDASGLGNHGTVKGATLTRDRFDNTDSAYDFNGVNNYITVPFNPVIEPSTFTLSVWIKTRDPNRGTIWTSDPDSYRCSHGYELGLFNGAGWANIDPSSACGNGTVINLNNRLNDDEWHHVVLFYDGLMGLYVDGVLQPLMRHTVYKKTHAAIRIGVTPNSVGGDRRFFLGTIDDIRLYNRILAEEEIMELFQER